MSNTHVSCTTRSVDRARASSAAAKTGSDPGVNRPLELRGLDVAAEVHQRLDGFRDERGCLPRVRKGVRPRAQRGGGARWIHLGLDHALDAVVDGAHQCDRAPVLACHAREEFAPCGRSGAFTHEVTGAVAAAGGVTAGVVGTGAAGDGVVVAAPADFADTTACSTTVRSLKFGSVMRSFAGRV